MYYVHYSSKYYSSTFEATKDKLARGKEEEYNDVQMSFVESYSTLGPS